MNKSFAGVLCVCCMVMLAMPGCGALSSAGDPGAARYFTIDPAPNHPGTAKAATPAATADSSGLRLGRVTGAPHLEERVVIRNSQNEIDYYREIRWTQPPERFLHQLLAHKLFEELGLPQLAGGAGLTLNVRLVAFEEVLGPSPLARAVAVADVRDEQRVLWQETLTAERPVVGKPDGDPATETVEAMAKALRDMAALIAGRVFSGNPGSR